MARIGTYAVDSTPENTDKMLGSSPTGVVKNFTLGDIATHYSFTGAIGISGQIPYRYFNNAYSGSRPSGSITINTPNTNFAFSSVTTIKLSKFKHGGNNTLQNFYTEFVDKEILIADIKNTNNYGVYTCTAVVQDSSETDFFDLTLIYKSGNGNLTNEFNYMVVLFAGAQDKDFTFLQNTGAATWTIAHNLNKFPSVMITTAAGEQVEADVSHTDKNNLTISFSGAVSGFAYLN
tara:strand:+ start:68 stop:769 length:702 start_codon:yes stop_codon:yes gene_type:complete